MRLRITVIVATFLCCLCANFASAQWTNVPLGDRNYLGLEAGINVDWQGGSRGFRFETVYPYNDLPSQRNRHRFAFNSLGSGFGFRVGGTIDFNLSQNWNLGGKIFYRSANTESVELRNVNFDQNPDPVLFPAIFFGSPTGTPSGTAEIENKIAQSFTYAGGNILLRYQLNPNRWYIFGGLEVESMMSNSTLVQQAIRRSDNDIQYRSNGTGSTRMGTGLSIAEHETDDIYKTLWAGPKVGIGTFIPIGSSDIVIVPELSVSIPLAELYNDQYTIFQDPQDQAEYVGDKLEYSHQQLGSITPNLWKAELSFAVKFPFGGTSTAMSEERSSEVVSTPPDKPVVSTTLEETDEIVMYGLILDKESKLPITDVEVSIIDLATNRVVKTDETGSNGKYEVDLDAPGRYSVTAEAEGYLFHTVVVEVDKFGRIQGSSNITLDKSQGKIRLLVFFETGKATLEQASLHELDRAVRLMKRSPTMEVEVAGHTDNVGSDASNKELSQKRAEAVVNYLVRNGVGASRLQAIGYGEAQPATTNDTDEGRAENRRVEFVVKKR